MFEKNKDLNCKVNNYAVKILIIYVVVSVVWILVFDMLIIIFFVKKGFFIVFLVIKGWFFVFIIVSFLYFLICKKIYLFYFFENKF